MLKLSRLLGIIIVTNIVYIDEIQAANSVYSSTRNKKSRIESSQTSWSPWSIWSPCTRPCGGGITAQSRECRYAKGISNRIDRKRGELVSPQCFGVHKRIHVCNNHACSPKIKDARTLQCEQFNNKKFIDKSYIWEPFLGAPNDCALNCRAIGHMFYATLSPAVMDGVPCRLNNSTFPGVCIGGNCQQVGCDGVVGSEKSLDKCGICGGDNSSCRLVSGIFTRPQLLIGYNVITQIPKGACNLTIYEMKHTNNYLALRYRNGSYIFNGDWAINRPGEYSGSGTTFNYRKGSNNIGQQITSPGPSTEPLDLMVVFQQTNPGIKYEYQLSTESPPESFIPPTTESDADIQLILSSEENVKSRHDGKNVNYGIDSLPSDEAIKPRNRSKKKKFTWKQAGYGECSRPCAGGIQNPIFICVRDVNQQPVLEKRCIPQEKPVLSPIRCNVKPCIPQWVIGEWSTCSVTCGPGFQRRTLVCQQEITPTLIVTVSDSACTNPSLDQISTRQPCFQPCEPNVTSYWNMSEWSSCSSPCGPGYKSRTVKCSSGRDEDCFAHQKPVSQVPCDSGACQTFTWYATEWSEQCSEECGMGLQTRKVHCSAGPDKEHLCEVNMRPSTSRPCSSDKDCNGKWFAGPWSQCSESCGHGKQSRQVVCVKRMKNENILLADSNCAGQDRPVVQQSCMVAECSQWFTSEWSPCSMPCDTGVQKREVICLNGEEQPSQSCNKNDKPPSRRACNTHSCSQSDVNVESNNLGDQAQSPTQFDLHPNNFYETQCTDQFKTCHVVVQARLCKSKFYRESCCQACRSSKTAIMIKPES